MKTTFKQYVKEAKMPKAVSAADLLSSIKGKKFTKDGSHLELDDSFICASFDLVTLIGAPASVTIDFNCNNNSLTTLEGAPKKASGNFFASANYLKSLEGAPASVGGDFTCRHNRLVDLNGGPTHVGGHFNCRHNNLTSLAGAPKIVGGSLDCGNNELTSLKDVHKQIRSIGDNGGGRISTLSRSLGFFDLQDNPIQSHVLGLLKIKNLKNVYLDNKVVEEIINKYLPEGDIFACQQELIDNGYEEYAQL